METSQKIEDLIIALSVMRARLQPRLSYVRAEAIAVASRQALIFPTYFIPRELEMNDEISDKISTLLESSKECIAVIS